MLSFAMLLAVPLTAIAVPIANASNIGQQLETQDDLGGLVMQPIISQKATYDSNPLLLRSNPQPLFGSVTTPEMLLTGRTPTDKFNLDTQVDQNFFNHAAYNSADFHSTGNYVRQGTQWSAGLAGNVDYDTTRTSEISTYGFRTQPVRHLDYALTPQVTYNYLPTDRWTLAATAQKTQYQSAVYSNYQTFTLSPSYTHDFDPLNSGVIKFNAEHYETTTGIKSKTDSVGPSVGWLTQLNERLSANANVGVETWRQQSDTGDKPWTIQYVFSTGMAFKGEQDKAAIQASRSEYPFGNGTQSLLTTFTLNEEHLLNEKLSAIFGASYELATYQIDSSGSLDKLASVQGGLTYHATEHVDFTGAYEYRYETLLDTSKGIDDHSVILGISYHPQEWTF